MTMVSPDSPRLRFGTTMTGADEVEFRTGGARIFLLVWLVAWAFGVYFVGSQILAGNAEPFLFIWLGLWVLGGGFAAFMALWSFFGSEVLSIDGIAVRHAYRMLGFTRQQQYFPHEIKGFRYHERRGRRTRSSGVEMAYGERVVRLFHGINRGEADRVVEALTRRLNLQPEADR